MRLLATTPEANLARLPVAFDLRAISLAEGVRAALSVAVLVAADEWMHWPPLLEAALGALLTCLGDAGGPIRKRLPALLAFTVLGALVTGGFGLLRSYGLAVAVPVACLGIFTCSFARIWGQAPLQVGNLLTVVLVLALDEPRGLLEALLLAGMFAAGSLWAVLLTMAIWRIYPFRPARRAVSDAYRSTARLVADLRTLIMANSAAEAWDAHARAHRRAVRDAIERARTAVQDTLRVRGQASPRAAQGMIRIEAIDQIFGALIALSDLLEATPDPAVRDAAARLLRLLCPVLRVVADAIRADDPGRGRQAALKRLARLGPAMDTMAGAGHIPVLAGITDAILGRLRAAVSLTAPAGWPASGVPDAPAGPWRHRLAGPLRANLAWQSASFRHALRTAVVAGPALGLAALVHEDYQHWLTITLILTMQPFYALTWQRALERISGTVAGGVVAAVVALVCTTPLTIAAALFPLAVLAFTARAVNYGTFIALLTPMVVLLTEFSRPDVSEFAIAGLRAAYTVAGGLLAVASCIALWPSWEPGRLQRELAAALLAHASFAEAELDALLGAGTDAAVSQARRSAGVASNNLETSISRALNEPRRAQPRALQAAMVTDAALRRMAGKFSALQVDPHGADGMTPTALRQWRLWIGGSLRRMAQGEAAGEPRPDGAAPDALLRIARQIELLEGAQPA